MLISCGAGSMNIHNVDTVTDVTVMKPVKIDTYELADSTLKAYTAFFKVPNPLVSSGSPIRAFDPIHENHICCWATLLDSVSSEVDMQYHCFKDSLDTGACETYRETYKTRNIRNGMFRIRITMESGFSPKSMEPQQWTMYIENAKGVMIEPADIVSSPVTSQRDSVYSDFHRVYVPRHLLKREITLYFNRTTFFGEDLLSSKNPYIVFVMTYEKRTIIRAAWKTSAFQKR